MDNFNNQEPNCMNNQMDANQQMMNDMMQQMMLQQQMLQQRMMQMQQMQQVQPQAQSVIEQQVQPVTQPQMESQVQPVIEQQIQSQVQPVMQQQIQQELQMEPVVVSAPVKKKFSLNPKDLRLNKINELSIVSVLALILSLIVKKFLCRHSYSLDGVKHTLYLSCDEMISYSERDIKWLKKLGYDFFDAPKMRDYQSIFEHTMVSLVVVFICILLVINILGIFYKVNILRAIGIGLAAVSMICIKTVWMKDYFNFELYAGAYCLIAGILLSCVAFVMELLDKKRGVA